MRRPKMDEISVKNYELFSLINLVFLTLSGTLFMPDVTRVLESFDCSLGTEQFRHRKIVESKWKEC